MKPEASQRWQGIGHHSRSAVAKVRSGTDVPLSPTERQAPPPPHKISLRTTHSLEAHLHKTQPGALHRMYQAANPPHCQWSLICVGAGRRVDIPFRNRHLLRPLCAVARGQCACAGQHRMRDHRPFYCCLGCCVVVHRGAQGGGLRGVPAHARHWGVFGLHWAVLCGGWTGSVHRCVCPGPEGRVCTLPSAVGAARGIREGICGTTLGVWGRHCTSVASAPIQMEHGA